MERWHGLNPRLSSEYVRKKRCFGLIVTTQRCYFLVKTLKKSVRN